MLFIESFDAGLHLDVAASLLKILAYSDVPVVVETHSGIVLRTAVLKQLRYYIFDYGTATDNLRSLESLWREVQIMAEL
jgi:predicted ATPase